MNRYVLFKSRSMGTLMHIITFCQSICMETLKNKLYKQIISIFEYLIVLSKYKESIKTSSQKKKNHKLVTIVFYYCTVSRS